MTSSSSRQKSDDQQTKQNFAFFADREIQKSAVQTGTPMKSAACFTFCFNPVSNSAPTCVSTCTILFGL